MAVALSRAGAAVLCADPDLAAAERTATLVRQGRVAAWAVQGAVDDEVDVALLAARARDLGGADLLVVAGGGAATTTLVAAVGAGRTVVLDPGEVDADVVLARLRSG
ncbi:hypothetical protein [Nocardioides sp. AX2bis]|uniref:hypothetical protein n=1 Tax=Nocardioides sp. AX2bis TaxID=2653157 RepID=UPI0012F23D57|nr:hypothetical protein [Nocardioides sp. AX2bis]VXB91848.1 hypothetical protein NOCARDAX2BIS_390007 [Nocardioides sp. AX2bis]